MGDATIYSGLEMSLKELQHPYKVDSSLEITFEKSSDLKDLFREFNRLRMTRSFCDAVLSTKDGASFWVHKIIMSSCSNYFRTLFTTSLVDKSCGEGSAPRTFYFIPNVSSTILEKLIKFAYSGIVDVSADNVNELLPAADQFNFVGVVDKCINFMLGNITIENCIGIWRFGKEYYMPRLEKEAHKFILAHFVDMSLNSEEFLHLNGKLLENLLSDDALNVPNELFVWIAIKRWCQHKYKKRHRLIPFLLPCVRLALLSVNDYRQIMDDPRVFRHIQCRNFINIVSKYILNELQDLSKSGFDKRTIFMFTPRHPYEIILASGGWTVSGPVNFFEVYDCRADVWKTIFTEDFGPRAYHQTLPLGEYVYIIGGSTGQDCLNSCWRFDTSNLRFDEISPMQEQRCFLSATILDNKIYAIGGYNGYDRLQTVEYYDQAQNQWIYISPMQEKRSDASASSLRSRIFVVGGFDGNDFLQSAECYYTEFDQWFYLPPMVKCRSGVACVAIDNAIYAIGGYDGEYRLKTVEKYCMNQKQWFATKSMKMSRSNFAVALLEKKIYVMGGYDDVSDNTTDQSECFDPAYPQWRSIAPLQVSRSGFSTCTFSGVRDITPFIRDNRFRCLLKNISKEETVDIESESAD